MRRRNVRRSGRQARQVLGAEVVGEVAVVTADREDMRQLGVLAAVRVARRQGGEVEAGRPPLGALEERVDLDVLELHVRGPQQDLGLAAAQRELVRADLEQGATRPERGDREIRRDTAGECDHRPGRNVLQERCQRRDRVARERICAVQHQDEGRLAAAQRIGEAGQGLRPDGSVLERERLERPRVDRLDAVERRRHVPQKRNGLVVLLVDRDPGERAGVAGGPLREQRRLPVAGRRHDQHERKGAGSAKPVHERGARHRPGRDLRNADLGFHHVEGQPRFHSGIGPPAGGGLANVCTTEYPPRRSIRHSGIR